MHFTASVIILATTAARLVLGASIQVNYYSDGGCSDYLTSVFPYDTGVCYGYEWNGMNSANIVNYNGGFGTPICAFYPEPNCQGGANVQGPPPDNCASNWGQGFQSMACGYF
jgi:hypothetical protein